jgi:hypothetical protein
MAAGDRFLPTAQRGAISTIDCRLGSPSLVSYEFNINIMHCRKYVTYYNIIIIHYVLRIIIVAMAAGDCFLPSAQRGD